jgi:hypothetical protein
MAMEEEEDISEGEFDDTMEPLPLGLMRQESVSDYSASGRPSHAAQDLFLGKPSPPPASDQLPRHSLDLLEARNASKWTEIGYRHPAPPPVSRASAPGVQPISTIDRATRKPAKRGRSQSTNEAPTGFAVQEYSSVTDPTISDKLLTIATCSTTSLTFRALSGEDISSAPPEELAAALSDLHDYSCRATDLGMPEEVAYLTRVIGMAGRGLTDPADGLYTPFGRRVGPLK